MVLRYLLLSILLLQSVYASDDAHDYLPSVRGAIEKDITVEYNWTNAYSARQSQSDRGTIGVFLAPSAYLHQPSTCWRHEGYSLDDIGILSFGDIELQYSRIAGKYAVWFVVWDGKNVDCAANRDELVQLNGSEFCVTYWIYGRSLDDVANLTRECLELIRPIESHCEELPSVFVRSFQWGEGEIVFQMSEARPEAIDIMLVEWHEDVSSQRKLTLPLTEEIRLKTSADKLVAYFGRPADKVYAERGYGG